MNILVALKQVPDTDSAITPREGGIDESALKWVINPYDEFALEEALLCKDRDSSVQVFVASVGPARVQESLRAALALGADEAYHIDAPANLDALPTARLLAALAGKLEADLVLAGQRGIDFDRGQTGPMIAELLERPHAGVVLATEWAADLSSVTVDREVEGGIEKMHLALPAVLTAQKGLNEPRLPSLKGKMAARKKSIATLTPSDLGVGESDLAAMEETVSLARPPERPAGRIIEGETVEEKVDALLTALRNEAQVL